jgi:hypothetical protein
MKPSTKVLAEIIPYFACLAAGFGFGSSWERRNTREILRDYKAAVQIAKDALAALADCRANGHSPGLYSQPKWTNGRPETWVVFTTNTPFPFIPLDSTNTFTTPREMKKPAVH